MKTNIQYHLWVMALDGETRIEGSFASPEEAWERNEDMGSRWYFYPIRVVTGAAKSRAARLVHPLPDGMPEEWEGKSVGTLAKALASCSSETENWIMGKAPLFVFP